MVKIFPQYKKIHKFATVKRKTVAALDMKTHKLAAALWVKLVEFELRITNL